MRLVKIAAFLSVVSLPLAACVSCPGQAALLINGTAPTPLFQTLVGLNPQPGPVIYCDWY